MPRENKKRGRRMQADKRKHADVDHDDTEDIQEASKRRKSTSGEPESVPTDETPPTHHLPEQPFFGLLDDEEQDFFRHADATLDANTFADADEKSAFLANVYREAEGKELKIANSQSCSRLLERLIQLSSSEQCNSLFDKFHGQ